MILDLAQSRRACLPNITQMCFYPQMYDQIPVLAARFHCRKVLLTKTAFILRNINKSM